MRVNQVNTVEKGDIFQLNGARNVSSVFESLTKLKCSVS